MDYINVPSLIRQARNAKSLSTLSSELSAYNYRHMSEPALRQLEKRRETSPHYKPEIDDILTKFVSVVEYGQNGEKSIRDYSSNFVQTKLRGYNQKKRQRNNGTNAFKRC